MLNIIIEIKIVQNASRFQLEFTIIWLYKIDLDPNKYKQDNFTGQTCVKYIWQYFQWRLNTEVVVQQKWCNTGVFGSCFRGNNRQNNRNMNKDNSVTPLLITLSITYYNLWCNKMSRLPLTSKSKKIELKAELYKFKYTLVLVLLSTCQLNMQLKQII
jgi:hypothetical protein